VVSITTSPGDRGHEQHEGEQLVCCVRSKWTRGEGLIFQSHFSERQVADAVLGPGHFQEWRERVPILERDGLPLIDELMGGRYLPAVRKFFEQRNA
jgi:hypothetical protein